MRLWLLIPALVLVLGLAACGKKGSPEAPGPADKITYPRAYPPY
jgi:predicted small lipoprotein YifL